MKTHRFKGSRSDLERMLGCVNSKPFRGHPRHSLVVFGGMINGRGGKSRISLQDASDLGDYLAMPLTPVRFSKIGKRINIRKDTEWEAKYAEA